MGRLEQVLDEIDAYNAGDPNSELVDGKPVAKEWIYGRRMSARLAVLERDPSEALQIAARAQHIARWKIPRTDYPMDRKGYKKWRSDLAAMHAELAASIMEGAGYDKPERERVMAMLRKQQLNVDAEVQTLEDCACLVFLEYYFEDFRKKHPRDKLLSILRKTWKKMSPAGQESALKLELGRESAELLRAALSIPS